jgi:hypothetical protein
MVAMSINTQAHAAGAAALEARAVTAIQENAIAKKFLAERLGVRGTVSLQKIENAIGRLSNPAQKLAVITALNEFAQDVADAKGNTVVIDQSAKSLFLTTGGQVKSLADVVATVGTRTDVAANTVPAQQINACDTKLIASATGLPEATVLKGYRTQLLNSASTCVLDGKISNAGLANAIESVAFAADFIAQGTAKKAAVVKGLELAIENDAAVDGVKKEVTAEQAAVAVDHLAGQECQVYQNL